MKPPRFTLYASRSTAARGFTILEMLVATGVLAVMITILFGLFGQGSSAWRQGERQADLNQAARMALDTFARDAMMAVIDINQETNAQTGKCPHPLEGLAVKINSSPSGGRPPPASPTQYGTFNDIYFVAATSLGNRPTNEAYRPLCGVRYYVAEARKPNGDRTELGQLIRTIYRPDQKTPGTTSIFEKAWWGGSSGPSGTFATNAVLADNVLSFRVQPLRSNLTYGVAPADPNMFRSLTGDKDYTINYEGVGPPADPTRCYRFNPGLIVGLAVVDRRLADRIRDVGLKQAAESGDFLVKTNWLTVFFAGYRQ